MKDEKTVFILGAGASHTYGYPLGKELRYNIVKNYLGALGALAVSLRDQRPNFITESRAFIDKFALSADLSIDIFLSKFPDFAFEGKMAILYSILKAETESVFLEDLQIRMRDTQRRRGDRIENDDWMWHLYDKLTRKFNSVKSASEINFDNISFVTFNYDRSLEHFIYTALENGFNYERIGGSPEEIFDKIRIEHVYGKVIDFPRGPKKDNTLLYYKSFNVDTTPISEWVENIRIVYEDRGKSLGNIYSIIRNANRIYFLGFGYDITNLTLLGFPEILSTDQSIFGTGLDLYDEEIEPIINYFQTVKLDNKPLILNSNCTNLLRKHYLIE